MCNDWDLVNVFDHFEGVNHVFFHRARQIRTAEDGRSYCRRDYACWVYCFFRHMSVLRFGVGACRVDAELEVIACVGANCPQFFIVRNSAVLQVRPFVANGDG